MKFFKRGNSQAPMAPGRNTMKPSYDGKTAHVVSDIDSYKAAQIAQVVAQLQPFTLTPTCAKCQSPAIATEHGSRYYVPLHPDAEERKTEGRYLGYSIWIPPEGSYEAGPEFLVRSCTVCQYAWAEHVAPLPTTEL